MRCVSEGLCPASASPSPLGRCSSKLWSTRILRSPHQLPRRCQKPATNKDRLCFRDDEALMSEKTVPLSDPFEISGRPTIQSYSQLQCYTQANVFAFLCLVLFRQLLLKEKLHSVTYIWWLLARMSNEPHLCSLYLGYKINRLGLH